MTLMAKQTLPALKPTGMQEDWERKEMMTEKALLSTHI